MLVGLEQTSEENPYENSEVAPGRLLLRLWTSDIHIRQLTSQLPAIRSSFVRLGDPLDRILLQYTLCDVGIMHGDLRDRFGEEGDFDAIVF